MPTTVLIASYLEPEHVERIRRVDTSLDVLYAPELLAAARYAADHQGRPFTRSVEQETAWRRAPRARRRAVRFRSIARPGPPRRRAACPVDSGDELGIGEYVARMGYTTSMPHTVFTTARGVHAQPLAEFCLMVMIAFRKKLLDCQRAQQARHWERFAGTDLRGRTIVIIGMGRVGTEVARLSRAFGLRVLGIKRSVDGADPPALHLDALYAPSDLHAVLPEAEHLVLIAPHTRDTAGMIGAVELSLMPAGAVLVNIARGALVDEAALVEALRSGHLAGAGLDVFAREPLPADSPLWAMDNVIICPHSASTSDRENARITDVFCANLRRFLDGQPLENLFDPALGF